MKFQGPKQISFQDTGTFVDYLQFSQMGILVRILCAKYPLHTQMIPKILHLQEQTESDQYTPFNFFEIGVIKTNDNLNKHRSLFITLIWSSLYGSL